MNRFALLFTVLFAVIGQVFGQTVTSVDPVFEQFGCEYRQDKDGTWKLEVPIWTQTGDKGVSKFFAYRDGYPVKGAFVKVIPFHEGNDLKAVLVTNQGEYFQFHIQLDHGVVHSWYGLINQDVQSLLGRHEIQFNSLVEAGYVVSPFQGHEGIYYEKNRYRQPDRSKKKIEASMTTNIHSEVPAFTAPIELKFGESYFSSNLTLVGMLKAAKSPLGFEPKWRPISKVQESFIGLYEELKSQLPSEVLSIAAYKKAPINRFFKKNGLSLRIERELQDNQFAVAAAFKAIGHWEAIGRECEVEYNGTNSQYAGKNFNGFSVEQGVRILDVDGHSYPVAIIETTEGYQVMVTPVVNPEETAKNAQAVARQIQKAVPFGRESKYGIVALPNISYDRTTDLGWLVGMSSPDGENRNEISEAKQQIILAMNQYGFMVNTGSYAAVLRGKSPLTFTVDREFFIAIYKPDLNEPIVAGVATPDCWKDPKVSELSGQ